MKKKILKIAALAAALALIVGVCWFANALVGNPISEKLATKTAERYLEEKFPETDFELERVTYSFKDTHYHAFIVSPSSPDSSFSLTIDFFGSILYDYYENNVLTGWNTANRLMDQYREAVDKVLDNRVFSCDSYAAYGELVFIPEEYKDEPDVPAYAIVTDTLELDGIYDINELGARAGKLTVALETETVTAEHLAQILLEVRTYMDEAGVSFYAIDCVLEYPKPETGEWNKDQVEVRDFLYTDIYEDGLEDRVRAADEAAKEYDAQQDAAKKQE